MHRRYVTVDVFTTRVFGGNPLAVVLDAEGLTTPQMQAIAREFNYSETTFVLPPKNPTHTAHVRIFTPRIEVPFAGHPNVGTAVVLARDLEAQSRPQTDEFLFEEGAGLVPIRLQRHGGQVVGAELTIPQPLTVGPELSADEAAACLTLASTDIRTAVHRPQVLSVGLPFLVVELTSRDALRRAKPDIATHERLLPPLGTDAVYAYHSETSPTQLHARTFSPLDNTLEDPATGSATAATIAMLATHEKDDNVETQWRIEQGVDMGRPSLLLGRTQREHGQVTAVHIGGQAVPIMRGTIDIPPSE
jgi:trans-2,3-dihydro-3-hydroxyanthranilate isomerase